MHGMGKDRLAQRLADALWAPLANVGIIDSRHNAR